MAGLYLHIPFCEHKCIYCDFYSIESLDPMASFLDVLTKEIAMYRGYGEHETFGTIFFGGGTPSLLAPTDLCGIINALHTNFIITGDVEITLEANPGTVDRRTLEEYRKLGINRISFGVQSFFDDDLRFLTRIHSSAQAKEAVRYAREAGFDNINIDLIYALPDQSMSRWEENLRKAVACTPEHLSAYSLIVEKNTPLHRMVEAKQVAPVPIEREAEMYQFTMEYLEGCGYEHYEVSNYARPGFRSRHNCNYWNHTNYLGFGPSAHSFWSGRRWWNVRNLNAYMEKVVSGTLPVAGSEELTDAQRVDETIMLGLRHDGVDLFRLITERGIDLLASCGEIIDPLVQDRLAVIDGGRLRLTREGFLLCDEITHRLLAETLLA